MRLVKPLFTSLLALVFCFSLAAQEENTGPRILLIDYMKSAPGQSGEYIDMETDVWADIHRQRQADGAIANWYFYDVRFTGTGSEYDYVTVTVVDGWEAVDAMYTSGNMQSYWDNLSEEQQAIAMKTESYRDLVRTDVVVINDWLAGPKFDGENFPKYAMVNFMDLPQGGWPAYMNMEKNIAKPMHEAMMKAGGGMAAWGLYTVAMPAGAHRPYDVVTADFFNEWTDIGGGDLNYEDLFEETLPNMNMDYADELIENTRTMVRRECWVLIDSI